MNIDNRLFKVWRNVTHSRRTLAAALTLVIIVGAGFAIIYPREKDDMKTEIQVPWLHDTIRYHEQEILTAANRYQIEPELIAIFITLESGGNPKAVSPVGAMGLMQIMPGTRDDIRRWRGIEENVDMFMSEQNIDFGTYYMKYLKDRFISEEELSENTVRVIAVGYNGGPGRAERLVEAGHDYEKANLPAETELYSKLAVDMWREKELVSSPTFEKWMKPVAQDGHNGHILIDNAKKELNLN